MSKSSKLMLFIVGGVAGLLVLVAVIAALLLRVNAKSRVEAMTAEALDMDVSIRGRVSIEFLPGLHIALQDVHAGRRGADIVSAKEVDLGIALLPLLRKEVRVRNIALKRLQVTLERDSAGKLNIERESAAVGARTLLTVAKASVSDGALTYANKQAGNGFEATHCNLEMRDFQRAAGESANFLQKLSFAAQAACGQSRTGDFTASDVKLSIAGKDGVFDFDPVTMQLFGGDGTASIRADSSRAVPAYHVRYRLAQLRIEEYFKAVSPKPVGKGSMDFTADLTLQGKTAEELKRSAGGKASLRGESLKLEIGDLDKKLSRYEASQTFNLVDLGALFFVGPVGLGVTKGYDFARVIEVKGGSTAVRTLVSNWQVEHGVAHATDVAMATEKSRVALKGGLDFVTARYDDVTVALVDDKGCSRVEQKIRGSFKHPETDKPNVLIALAGPARKLLRRAADLFRKDCTAFYTGSVAPPK